jgi:uncharacterized protein YuzE
MRLDYDKAADALDIVLGQDEPVARTEEVDPGTLVDFDEGGRVVAIEVLRPARRWPLATVLERYPIDEESAQMLRALWAEPGRYPFADPGDLGTEAATSVVTST